MELPAYTYPQIGFTFELFEIQKIPTDISMTFTTEHIRDIQKLRPKPNRPLRDESSRPIHVVTDGADTVPIPTINPTEMPPSRANIVTTNREPLSIDEIQFEFIAKGHLAAQFTLVFPGMGESPKLIFDPRGDHREIEIGTVLYDLRLQQLKMLLNECERENTNKGKSYLATDGNHTRIELGSNDAQDNVEFATVLELAQTAFVQRPIDPPFGR